MIICEYVLSAKHPESDWFNCYFDDYKRKAGYLASARSTLKALRKPV